MPWPLVFHVDGEWGGYELFLQKYIGLDIPQFWKQIGRISLSVGLCLVVGYGVDHVFPGTGKLAFLLKILGYTVLYGAVVYLWP